MHPVIPHLISECLSTLKEDSNFDWPDINNEYLDNKTVNIVVQINGKKRGLLVCENNISEKKLCKYSKKLYIIMIFKIT